MTPSWPDGLRRKTLCGAPPSVLARPWRDVDFCVMDFETTGLDLRRDAIVSYGAVVVRGGRIVGDTAIYGLVDPACEVSARSVQVHALRQVDVANAPSSVATAHALRAVLDTRVLVAHAAWIEQAFLSRYLAEAGYRPSRHVVDTAALARAAAVAPRAGQAEPSLEWLAMKMNLPVHTPHHALGDAMTTATLFLALCSALSRTRPALTVGDLRNLSRHHSLTR